MNAYSMTLFTYTVSIKLYVRLILKVVQPLIWLLKHSFPKLRPNTHQQAHIADLIIKIALKMNLDISSRQC